MSKKSYYDLVDILQKACTVGKGSWCFALPHEERSDWGWGGVGWGA